MSPHHQVSQSPHLQVLRLRHIGHSFLVFWGVHQTVVYRTQIWGQKR